MHTVTFFVTTARSGTQWLCATLQALYPDLLAVEHEPIGYAYSPKRYLRNPAAADALRSDPVVRAHFDKIHQVLKQKDYVEVGFPAFAAAPVLAAEFGERLRIVQLVRHPVRVAASIASQRWFDPGARNDIKADIMSEPTDPGARLQGYEDRWETMTAYEKGLFYWGEVHLCGQEVRKALPAVPFLQTTLEQLLSDGAAQKQLADFLGVPYRSMWSSAPAKRVDFHRRKIRALNRAQIAGHPQIMVLAANLGYDIGASEILQYRLVDAFRNVLSAPGRILRLIASGTRAALLKVLDAVHLGGVARRMKHAAKARAGRRIGNANR